MSSDLDEPCTLRCKHVRCHLPTTQIQPFLCKFIILHYASTHRLQEADRALSQALCLGFADPSLLREIGNCYVAAGRLDAAEDALRKSLAADTRGTGGDGAGGEGGAGNPHTRRCLADVLSARNSTSQVRAPRALSDDRVLL